MRQGMVKSFSVATGYGFIGDPGVESDVLVHHREIQMPGYRLLKQGQAVTYELEKTDKGYRARDVRVIQREQKARVA